MKTDKKMWFAIAVLLGLISWLIILSYQKQGNQNLNIALNKIDSIERRLNELQQSTTTVIQQVPVNGANGSSGNNGTNGLDGKDARGEKGDAGSVGPAGASAYDLWLSLGNIGDVNTFISSLKAPAPLQPREIEVRCNSTKLQNEWRYKGDSAFKPLDKVIACVGP